VLGKPIGIVTTSFLVTRFRRISLDDSIGWPDIMGVGVLAGIGFTVSLLVAELSFPTDQLAHDDAKIGVLLASLIASLLAAVVLGLRNRRYRAWELADTDADDD
jgi:NhaA family Na+:H+ antiporter